MTWNELGQSKYVQLTTFKSDGTPVGTPVWIVSDGDRLLVWTSRESWKVKRIRRNPAVTLQACNNRGTKLIGDVITANAEIQDAAATERTRAVIAKKYGFVGSLLIKGSKLVRGADATVGLVLRP